MTEILFEFKKQNNILGIECGYYFKGLFLNRYKTEALKILRERIEDAGSKVKDNSKTNFEKGKTSLPSEWQVLHEENEKVKRKTDLTYQKKKPYYAEFHKTKIKHDILTLKERIRMKEIRKEEVIKDFDNSIQQINEQINLLEEQLK